MSMMTSNNSGLLHSYSGKNNKYVAHECKKYMNICKV